MSKNVIHVNFKNKRRSGRNQIVQRKLDQFYKQTRPKKDWIIEIFTITVLLGFTLLILLSL